MRRPRSILARIVIAVGVVTGLYWPFANYIWTLFNVNAYDPVTSANPVFVSGPVGALTGDMIEHTWWIALALPEAVFGALAGIAVFALLGGVTGSRRPRETLCRSCGRVLRDLVDPECPSCGEHL